MIFLTMLFISDVSLFGWSSLASFNNLISNLFYIIGGLFLLAYTYILENSESRERIKRLNPALAEDEFLFYAIGIHFHLGNSLTELFFVHLRNLQYPCYRYCYDYRRNFFSNLPHLSNSTYFSIWYNVHVFHCRIIFHGTVSATTCSGVFHAVK